MAMHVKIKGDFPTVSRDNLGAMSALFDCTDSLCFGVYVSSF